ncbi:MAG: RebB family R body protein, partial [Pannonibacter indicus]
YQVSSHATGLSIQNAVHSQQALNQVMTAVVSKAVQLIMEVGQ